MAHVILFEHANFHGAHKHVLGAESNLNASDDNFFNDRVSSIVVLEGNWAFYRNSNFNGQYARILGPGAYPSVGNVDIQNDDMSSLRPV
jgi:Beta/Gamma crystallin